MRSVSFRGLVVGLGLLAGVSTAHAAPTFVVNSPLDLPASANVADEICETGPGNGVCTLRAAIMEANAVVGGGATIEIPAGTFFLTRAGAGEDGSVTGDFDLVAPMTIQGQGPAATVLDGNLLDRLFDVRPTATVTIRDLLVQRGDAKGGNGGGILNAGELTLVDVHVTGNVNYGGVVTNGGLSVDRSVIADNGAFSGGTIAGGLTVLSGGSAVVVDSWIRNNQGNEGGGVLNQGTLRVERTMIRGNEARFTLGSGIRHLGSQLTVVNSTLTENVKNGGLYVDGTGSADVVQSSILHNDADSTVLGGIMVTGTAANRLVLRSSLVAGNTVAGLLPRDCVGGPIVSGDYNLIGTRSTCLLSGNVAHVNAADFPFPLLTRTWNGGFSLDQGSAGLELDQIPAAACTDDLGAPLRVDQRGFVRDALCDVGAIEFSRGALPPQLLDAQLLRNGGAEGDELGTASVSPVALPHFWIASEPGFMTPIRYGEAGGYPLATEAPPGSGSTFFGGGNTPFSGGSQVVDISGIATEIDAGLVEYTASGAFGGYLTDDDSASLTVSFQDENGADLGTVALGGFSASDRGNLTGLLPDSRVGLVPVGTRLVDVRLAMTRTDGVSNDGYADDLSLVLPEPSTGAALCAGLSLLAQLGSRRPGRPAAEK